MDLFIDSALQFEKTSGEATLPEDPNAWSNEVLQELFKQVPYIADFEPHVVMDKLDAEKGYGFGHVEVINKTEIQQGTSPQALMAAGIKQAKIPIVIKNRRLQPFDLMITEDGKCMPLTESRLRQAIFRPSAFDITGRGPGDNSMVGQLYPPNRYGYGQSGGSMAGGSMGAETMKMGSVKEALSAGRISGAIQNTAKAPGVAPGRVADGVDKLTDFASRASGPRKAAITGGIGGGVGGGMGMKMGSVLAAIMPTVLEEDYNAFFKKIASKEMQAAYIANGLATGDALSKIAAWEPHGLQEPDVTPDVVQIRRGPDGYIVKSASHLFWSPKEETYDRGQVCKTFGTKVAFDADMNGAVTMANGPASEPMQVETEADKYELITNYGIYKVRTDDGKELIGYVFPNLMDIDGTPLPLSLFTNGSQKALQGEIAGVSVGTGASLFEGPPQGTGCFYEVLPNGKAQATVAMTIVATLQNPGDKDQGAGGVTLHARTFDGREVEVEIQPNIEKLTSVDEGRMIVPSSMSWLPLDEAEDVHLMADGDSAGAIEKMSAATPYLTVQIRSGGSDSYSLSGLPLDKIASDDKSFLSFDDAVFMLGGLGVSLEHATKKLAEAAHWSAPLSVQAAHHLITAEQMMHGAVKHAAKELSQYPDLRRDLVKEAAVIPDPSAVDTILSLGFINDENLRTFISYLPKIDESQKKMCELLLASRLGMKDIPGNAVEKAIRSTEEVITGLKGLAFTQA